MRGFLLIASKWRCWTAARHSKTEIWFKPRTDIKRYVTNKSRLLFVMISEIGKQRVHQQIDDRTIKDGGDCLWLGPAGAFSN